jgi:hypothetical protein
LEKFPGEAAVPLFFETSLGLHRVPFLRNACFGFEAEDVDG